MLLSRHAGSLQATLQVAREPKNKVQLNYSCSNVYAITFSLLLSCQLRSLQVGTD
jgi:hypothetical protein